MSNGVEFFQTLMGRKFYEADVPRIVEALEKLAAAVEAATNRPAAPLAIFENAREVKP